MRTGSAPAVWPLLLSEGVGTALLVAVGGSVVVWDFGPASPMLHLLPDAALRRALTGFLFGAVGGAIALSPVGRVSGAHINPAVTWAFWLRRTISGRLALGYVLAQLVGAVVGAALLLAWGGMAQGGRTAATVPGPAGALPALLGEVAATFCLVGGLFGCLGHRRLRRFTPFLFAPLYALLVEVEAPWSGTSTNPARTFGPALVAHLWRGWPVYWLGPGLGALLAVGALSGLARYTAWEVRVAKLAHLHRGPRRLLGPWPRRRGAPTARPRKTPDAGEVTPAGRGPARG